MPKTEDVVGAALTGGAPTMTIWLPNLIAYKGVAYIRGLGVSFAGLNKMDSKHFQVYIFLKKMV